MANPTDDEAFVRSVWRTAHLRGVMFDDGLCGYVCVINGDTKNFHAHRLMADAWAEAAAYTRDVLEQVAKLEAEINLVSETRRERNGVDHSRWTRILNRLGAALAELQKDMKL